MSRTLTISDEAYETLFRLAGERGQTLEAAVEAWAAEHARTPRDPRDPRYQTFEEFFSELGMSREEIQEAKERAAGDAVM